MSDACHPCKFETDIQGIKTDNQLIKSDLATIKKDIGEIKTRLYKGDEEFKTIQIKQAEQNGYRKAQQMAQGLSYKKAALIFAAINIVTLVIFKLFDFIK